MAFVLDSSVALSWCFEDEVGMLIPDVRGHTRIPPSPLL